MAFRGEFTMLPDEILEQAGIDEQYAIELAEMNDDGVSFEIIAKEIELEL